MAAGGHCAHEPHREPPGPGSDGAPVHCTLRKLAGVVGKHQKGRHWRRPHAAAVRARPAALREDVHRRREGIPSPYAPIPSPYAPIPSPAAPPHRNSSRVARRPPERCTLAT
eukprot:3048460-Pyramimonas_sp.AAC.1